MKTKPQNSRSDSDRNLVLIAKNSFIWLSQLSEKYQKPIHHLDQIPIEELDWLKSFGINGLWLIGIWERSPASYKIKQLYGHNELVASAYSINSYEIAQSIGGPKALELLKRNAQKTGIELACDMVPNHTGLDAPWLIDHPDWYISTDEKPKDEWQFNSPNLIANKKIEISLEEGYYTQTGASEVFRYSDQRKNSKFYIYHGNDGTSMPWNDTAQLNYLNPMVREAVKNQIIKISKMFRIIRLDAAMTLVRQHYRRLWFPQAGEKKCVPTRERFIMTQADFDRRMPDEFWAEVMKEIEDSSPDTLLLAEAFWLMERFFIEDLGIHRVYNSAFMNNLRDEKNASLRQYLMEILNQNPTNLERFVNYLTTPDERTAVDLFGKSDKYFGACSLMAVLPGLPLFGHGQIEGLKEQYGMDVPKPFLNESPDEDFLQEHFRLISPLLLERDRFSSAENLVLFDFHNDRSDLDENVIVFINIVNGKKSLILFNNQRNPVSGYVGKARNKNNKLKEINNPLNHILHLLNISLENNHIIILNDLQQCTTRDFTLREIEQSGLKISLPAYGFHAFDISCR